MRTRVAVLAVLLCIVVAGCSAPVSLPEPGEGDVETPGDATQPPRTGSTPDDGSDGDGEERDVRDAAWNDGSTPVPAVDNPYDEETLTVAVDDANVSAGRDVRPAVRDALDFWEANSRHYAGYAVDYRLLDEDSDTSDADLVVQFVDDIRDCGREQHVAGCAPYITRGPVDRPAVVRIKTGFDANSTTLVLEHELGHTLGLGHDDEPSEVMAGETMLTTQPKTDATDRELAWNHSTLSVYVDYGDADDRQATERQVAAALGYFEDGAEGTVPENVSFVRVDDPGRADVVVRFADDLQCGTRRGSCGRVEGYDPDGDGRLETYSKLEVTIANLDTEAVAWHVARWVGRGLSLDSDAEYPEPLRETTSAAERRTEWWR
ncbi:matrixin family metalloprotease [Halomarina salina]|uniref:Matrixin family metalloprotease n=1 Tax=Halomarina salina TaxID=1872699 RepID=A0ABD5RKR3_9EURY|nr:matrixin family metalloprotease [Halomarina salina]